VTLTAYSFIIFVIAENQSVTQNQHYLPLKTVIKAEYDLLGGK